MSKQDWYHTWIKTLLMVLCCYLAVPATALDKSEIADLFEQLDRLRAAQNTPAYSLVITDAKQTLVSELRGLERAGEAEVIYQGRWFRVGSITKTFVALASLVAEDKHHLNLQQTVIDTLGPGYFQNPWAASNPLTLEQLLEQTSGLPDMSKAEWDHNTPIPLDVALRQFADKHRLQWPAGAFYSYSNTNYGLAGLVLEKATRQTAETLITEQVLKPLAISKASLSFKPYLTDRLITGYNRDGKTPIPYWHTLYRPLGELSIAPGEMAKLIRVFLNDGAPIISAKQLRRMETPQTSFAAQAGLDYGYGLGLYDWFVKGHRFYGHGGDGDGYLAHFGYSKETGLGYFLVINAFQPDALRAMRGLVEAALTKDLEAVEKEPGLTVTNPELYVGTYQAVTWRFGGRPSDRQLTISVRGQQLMAQFSNEKAYPLIAVGPGLFRWPVQSAATMAIVATKQGMVFSGDEGHFVKRSVSAQ